MQAIGVSAGSGALVNTEVAGRVSAALVSHSAHHVVAGLYHLSPWYWWTLCGLSVALGAVSFHLMAVISELGAMRKKRDAVVQVRAECYSRAVGPPPASSPQLAQALPTAAHTYV